MGLLWPEALIEKNFTRVTEFVFLEFQHFSVFNPGLFVFFLMIYILTLIGNLTLITLVVSVHSLKSPMYVFLSQLSLSDTLLTTNIAPNMLHIILNRGSKISVTGCITQMYIHGVSATAELLLLTVMSYDRFLAICDPLHYMSIMNPSFQFDMIFSSWLLAILIILIFAFLIYNMQFCGPHTIDHYFCDLEPLLELSCSDHTIVKLLNFVLTLLIAVAPFFFILYTYISIFITIYGISTTTGKQKALSTCSSHLIVVSMYYGTLITVYIIPKKGQKFNINKALSLIYTMGTPLFNPIVYSLRNQEIKVALANSIIKSLQNIKTWKPKV